jgi:hypothetical protein
MRRGETKKRFHTQRCYRLTFGQSPRDDGSHALPKFNSSGTFPGTFVPAIELRDTDSIDPAVY